MLIGMHTVKVMLLRLQMEMRNSIGIGLEATTVIPQQRIWMHILHILTLWETELNGDGLVYVVEQISWQ
jgi:hypothetical protein